MKQTTSILYLFIAVVIGLGVFGHFARSSATVNPAVGVYLASVNPQNDWSVMARVALGADISEAEAAFLKILDGDTANDYATYILAITALGEDPRSFGSENLVYGLRQKASSGQIGDVNMLSDDIFGLLALRAAGVSTSDPLASQTVSYLKTKQFSDGGWDWSAGSNNSSVDYTAMGIMALLSAGVAVTDDAIMDAADFLLMSQNDDGGFGMVSGEASNTASTAWVLSAIYAMGDDPGFWAPLADSPIDYLAARQHADGYFLFNESSAGSDQFTQYTTSYAAIALSEKYYPVASITALAESSLRIEGQNNTVCNLDSAQGLTALDVIKASADVCGYTYVIQEYEWGPYLTTINNEAASGNDGWIFVANNEHLQVGANQFAMAQGDELVLYYGAWDAKLSRVSHNESSVEIGDTTTAMVEEYDSAAWSALAGATLKRGNEDFITDANGQMSLSWDADGAYYLYAEAEGSVRSEKILVIAGHGAQSQSLGMSATIGSSSGQNPGAGGEEPGESSVVFGVAGDLSFGILAPGQSATKQAVITNSGSVAMSTTATVEGSSLFVNNTWLDNVAPSQWQKVILSGNQSSVDVTLSVPSSYVGSGTEQGTLIFWANAMQ